MKFKCLQCLSLILFIFNCLAAEIYRFDFSEGANAAKTYDSVNGYECNLVEGATLSTSEYLTSSSSLHFTTMDSALFCPVQPVIEDTPLVQPKIWIKQKLVSDDPRIIARNYGVFARPRNINGEGGKPCAIQLSTMTTPFNWSPFGKYDLFDSQWHHIGITYQTNLTLTSLYVDFQLDVTRYENGNFGTVPGDNVNDGDIVAGGYWTGYLDSVVLHDKAMTLDELRMSALSRIDGNQEICDSVDNTGSGTSDTPQLECALLLDEANSPVSQESPCLCGTGNETRMCQPMSCKWLVEVPCDVTCAPTNAPTSAPSPSTLAPTLAPIIPTRRPSQAPTASSLFTTTMSANEPSMSGVASVSSTLDTGTNTQTTQSELNATSSASDLLDTGIIVGIGAGGLLLVVCVIFLFIVCVRRRSSSTVPTLAPSNTKPRHDSRGVRLRAMNNHSRRSHSRRSHSSRSTAGASRTSRTSRRGMANDSPMNATYAVAPSTIAPYQAAPARLDAVPTQQYDVVNDPSTYSTLYMNSPVHAPAPSIGAYVSVAPTEIDDEPYGTLALRTEHSGAVVVDQI